MQTAEIAGPRLLTPQELAGCIRAFREARQWSQETLAALSRLSVRTVQRVERGEPSDIDTRRALARAFDAEDLDVFNKPYSIPTAAELKAQQEQFEHDHVTLDLCGPTSGRELVLAFESAVMDSSTPAVELDPASSAIFAGLIDYLREYRDWADSCSETEKLKVFSEVQHMLDELNSAGLAVSFASRHTMLVGTDCKDKTPWAVSLIYVTAFRTGNAPAKIAVPRKVSIG